MNTFTRALASAAFLALCGSSAYAVSAYSIPPGGDCDAFAAAGRGGYWVGRFSGSYEDVFDHRWPIAAQACFQSEYECRRWINQAQSAAPDPAAMSCRRARS